MAGIAVIHDIAAMGTVVSIEGDAPQAALARAVQWFREVEAVCSRFDEASELRQLPVGVATPASPMLFEAVRFALKVAEETQGAFDPTVGSRMAPRGSHPPPPPGAISAAPGVCDANFRDVVLDAGRRTILLKRPLTLDLG